MGKRAAPHIGVVQALRTGLGVEDMAALGIASEAVARRVIRQLSDCGLIAELYDDARMLWAFEARL